MFSINSARRSRPAWPSWRGGLVATLMVLHAGVAAADAPATDTATGTSADAALLSPDRLVGQVLANNPGIAALDAAVTAARERITPATRLDDPVLSYALAPASLGADDLDPGHIIGIVQPLPWPGKLAARGDAARADAASVQARHASIQRDAIRDARLAYADWYVVHAAIDANRSQQVLLASLADTARGLYRSGSGSQQAVLTAELRRTRRQREALDLGASRQAIAARINALRATPATDAVGPPAAVPDLQALPDIARLESAMRMHHPELARIDAAGQASQARIRLAELDKAPDFRVSARYLGTLPREENRAQIGVAVNLPFGPGGQARRAAQRAAAQADYEQLAATHQDTRARLVAQLVQRRAAASAARDTVALYDTALLPLARQTLEAVLADYASGAGDVRDVIDAANDVLDARVGAARAAAAVYTHRAELAWLTGGALDHELLGVPTR